MRYISRTRAAMGNTEISGLSEHLSAGVAYLARAQNPGGSWTDFWLPVGTSDAWVTAFVGLALLAVTECQRLREEDRRIAMEKARQAAGWLLSQPRPKRGWGYNASVAPDADTTAHALSLLARLGEPVPAEAVEFLSEHRRPGDGFGTYRFTDPAHHWTHPCADVTAAALRALFDLGVLEPPALERAWAEDLAESQDERGGWDGLWWITASYPTGLALEVWQIAGRPPLRYPLAGDLPEGTAFDRAWAALAKQLSGDRAGALAAIRRLLADQQVDGSWPAAPILRVPPSHQDPAFARPDILAADKRRLFATASAVRSLALAAELLPPDWPAWRCARPGRSPFGRELDRLVEQAAHTCGFPERAAIQARQLHARLTRRSLANPNPWPATQFSSLAGGSPLEFSVTVGADAPPALRYAVEVGNPLLPAYARARQGIEDLASVAEELGYAPAWQRVQPAVDQLVRPDQPVPDDLRFWVWSGIDQAAPGSAAAVPPPGIKIYLNLLHHEAGAARPRLEAALSCAQIPLLPQVREILDRLDRAGFPQEMGFGLGPAGKIACKVYYELRGWRRPLVRQILGMAGLPDDPDSVCPQIPGIIQESLAAKSRAGIALRLDPDTGAVRELTIAAAFPPPMLAPAETSRRVAAWIESLEWSASNYRALAGLLLPAWERHERFGRLHSLFTRTISAASQRATIYLRPCLSEFSDN